MRMWSLMLSDVADFDDRQCAALRRALRQQIDKHQWRCIEDCPVYVQSLVIELEHRELELERMGRLF